MLVSEQLITYVLAVVLTVTAGLVLVSAHERLLLQDERVEGLESVTWIVFKLDVQELLLHREDVLDSLNCGMSTSEDGPACGTCKVLGEFTILVEKQAWNIFILEVWHAFGRTYLHELPRWVPPRQFMKCFHEHGTLWNATGRKNKIKHIIQEWFINWWKNNEMFVGTY